MDMFKLSKREESDVDTIVSEMGDSSINISTTPPTTPTSVASADLIGTVLPPPPPTAEEGTLEEEQAPQAPKKRLPGPSWRMTKEERAPWQPVAKVECKLGPPFPKNFYWWSSVKFSHPFTPADYNQTQYPGAVLLNHPCFIPREGEVRGSYGKAYFYFDPEDTESLQTQIGYLEKAINITQGHYEDIQKDAIDAKVESDRLKKRYSVLCEEIKTWKRKTILLSHDVMAEKLLVDEREQKTITKMGAVDLLNEEKKQLQKRIRDVEKSIADHDDEIVALNCQGCEMDPNLFMMELENAREVAQKKTALVGVLEDEKKQIEGVIQTANLRVAKCIHNLRNLNDMMIQMSYGNYKKRMEKAKGKYAEQKF